MHAQSRYSHQTAYESQKDTFPVMTFEGLRWLIFWHNLAPDGPSEQDGSHSGPYADLTKEPNRERGRDEPQIP